MQWFRFYNEALDDPKVQTLPDNLFREKFLACLSGDSNEFSRFIEGPHIQYMRPDARYWAKIRSKVFERDDYTCQYCGVRGGNLECDHVKPVCKGGKTHLRNLKTACFFCNRSKGKKSIKDWK